MDSIAVHRAGEYQETADRLSRNMAVGNRAVLTTRTTFMGPGTTLALTPIAGVRLAIVGVDVVVRNPGAGIGGGLVTVGISREGNNLANLASDAAGAYTQIVPTVGVPASTAPALMFPGLITEQPHVTIAYDGTNPLARIVSTLAAGDLGEVILRYYAFAAGLFCP